MSSPYGRRPTTSQKQKEAPQAVEVQVNITERHTMEQLALEVQRALAMVQDYGAFGMEKFRFRLLPLDHDGKPIVLRDAQGEQVLTINIPEEPAQPIYRQDEPGVDIRLTSNVATQHSPAAASPQHAPRTSRA